MKTLFAGLILSLVLAALPVPKITVKSSTLLYAAAMYKTAIGDTQSALRLMRRAEQAQQPAASEHLKTVPDTCDWSTTL